MRRHFVVAIVACLVLGSPAPAAAHDEDCRFGEGWLLVTARMSWTLDLRGEDGPESRYSEDRAGPLLITICEINRIWITPDTPAGGSALDLRAPEGVSYRLFVEESLKELCRALPNCRDATD